MSFIPSPSDLWNTLKTTVISEINKATDSVVSWLWHPLRSWLGDVAWLLINLPSLAREALRAFAVASGRLFEFFDDAPRYVAGWVLAGFLYWINGVGDLLDDYVDRHWDD